MLKPSAVAVASSDQFTGIETAAPSRARKLHIYDATFAGDQVQVFAQDKDKSRLMTRAEFMNRSAAGKLFDRFAGMSRRQL